MVKLGKNHPFVTSVPKQNRCVTCNRTPIYSNDQVQYASYVGNIVGGMIANIPPIPVYWPIITGNNNGNFIDNKPKRLTLFSETNPNIFTYVSSCSKTLSNNTKIAVGYYSLSEENNISINAIIWENINNETLRPIELSISLDPPKNIIRSQATMISFDGTVIVGSCMVVDIGYIPVYWIKQNGEYKIFELNNFNQCVATCCNSSGSIIYGVILNSKTPCYWTKNENGSGYSNITPLNNAQSFIPMSIIEDTNINTNTNTNMLFGEVINNEGVVHIATLNRLNNVIKILNDLPYNMSIACSGVNSGNTFYGVGISGTNFSLLQIDGTTITTVKIPDYVKSYEPINAYSNILISNVCDVVLF